MVTSTVSEVQLKTSRRGWYVDGVKSTKPSASGTSSTPMFEYKLSNPPMCFGHDEPIRTNPTQVRMASQVSG